VITIVEEKSHFNKSNFELYCQIIQIEYNKNNFLIVNYYYLYQDFSI